MLYTIIYNNICDVYWKYIKFSVVPNASIVNVDTYFICVKETKNQTENHRNKHITTEVYKNIYIWRYNIMNSLNIF